MAKEKRVRSGKKIIFVFILAAFICLVASSSSFADPGALGFGYYGWDKGDAQHTAQGWQKGAITLWKEGEWVPYMLVLTNKDTTPQASPALWLTYDHYNSQNNAMGFDNQREYNWKVWTGTADTDIPLNQNGTPCTPGATFVVPQTTGPSYPASSTQPTLSTYLPPGAFTVPPKSGTKPGKIAVQWLTHLSVTAYWLSQSPPHNGSSFYPGASLHVTLVDGGGSLDVPTPVPPKPTGMLSGYKSQDAVGGLPLNGWTITLSGTANVGGDGDSWPVNLTAVTGQGHYSDGSPWPSGYYEFRNMVEGSYMVTETLQPNWTNVVPGNLPPSYSYPNFTEAQIITDVNFANSAAPQTVFKTFTLTVNPPIEEATYYADYSQTGSSGPWTTVALTNQTLNTFSSTVNLSQGNTWWKFRAMEDTDLVWESDVQGPENLTQDTTNSFTLGYSLNITPDNPVNLVGEDETFTLTATTSDGKPLSYTPTNIQVGPPGTLTTPTPVVTDSSGTATFTVTSSQAGTSDIRAWIDMLGGTSGIYDTGEATDTDTKQWTQPPPSSISGMKFNDLDGDGVKDDGEPGLSGWTIDLKDSTGSNLLATAGTDQNGSYIFNNVQPDTYRVYEEPQASWTQTYPTNPNFYTVTITDGLNVTGKDFGNVSLITVNKTFALTVNNSPPGVSCYAYYSQVGSGGPWTELALTEQSGNTFSGTAPFLPTANIWWKWRALSGGSTIWESNVQGPETLTQDTTNSYTTDLAPQPTTVGYNTFWLLATTGILLVAGFLLIKKETLSTR